MDPLALAIGTFFVVAAFASAIVVLRYRIKDVPIRGALIEKACKAFDERSKDGSNGDSGGSLIIDDPKGTFERYHSYGRYALPLAMLVILQVAASFILASWLWCRLGSTGGACGRAQLPLVIVMALAGGMVWTLQQVIARTHDGELGPPDIYELIIGLLSAVPIGYAFSLVIEDKNKGALIAFGASAFPVRETARMIREFTTRRMLDTTEKKSARPAERHIGSAIEGVSDDALSRLSELRIVTVLDIAYSNPVDVMVQTGFPLMVIVDWIDQAIWALYAGDKKGVMTSHGIRCSIDVCEFVNLHLYSPDGELVKSPDRLTPNHRAALDAAAAKMEVDAQMLMDLFFRIYNDPQVKRLRQLWYPDGMPKDLRSGVTLYDVPSAEELSRDDALWKLYECSFPANEREPAAVIIDSVRDGAGIVVRARSEGTTNGFSVVHLLKGPPSAAFLVYLAVRPAYRSRGLGSELLSETWRVASEEQARTRTMSAGMIWEVDIPEGAKTSDEKAIRDKRIAFFERWGAYVLKQPYEQPPVNGKDTVRMALMFRPAGTGKPNDDVVRALVDAMYLEKYQAQNGIDPGTIAALRAKYGSTDPAMGSVSTVRSVGSLVQGPALAEPLVQGPVLAREGFANPPS